MAATSPAPASADPTPTATASTPTATDSAPTATASTTAVGEFAPLVTTISQVRRPNCWSLVLRGRLANPYEEAVDGARMIVRLRTSGEQPRELERLEVELDIRLAAGATKSFSRELTTPCSSSYRDIAIVSFATRRGDLEVPTPTRDIELAASKPEEANAGAANIPIVTSPVVIPDF